MPCVEQPEDLSGQPPMLYVARNNEPAEPLGAGQYELRNVDGAVFPTLEWDDVPVHRGADRTERDTFFVADANSNVWVHGGDLRTIAPRPVVPTGIASATPAALDARIQIVWPHDENGNYAPVSSARYVNIAVDLFGHGTLDSVPVGYQLPGSIDLYEAVGNSPLLSTTPPPNPWLYEGVDGYHSAPVVTTTYTINGTIYPRWVFNDVPSTINFPDYFLVQVQGIPTYPTVWTNAVDGRTSMPNPTTPPACTP